MSTNTAPVVAADIHAMLNQLAKPKAEAPSSSKTPALRVQSLADACAEYADVHRLIKDAEARKAMLAADIMALAEPQRVELSRAKGECLSSVKINNLTYIVQSKYPEVRKPELVAAIEATFGDDTPLYFKKQFSVSIDATKLTPEVLQALTTLGAEVTWTLQATKQFHEDRTMRPEIAAKAATLPDVKPTAFFRAS